MRAKVYLTQEYFRKILAIFLFIAAFLAFEAFLGNKDALKALAVLALVSPVLIFFYRSTKKKVPIFELEFEE